MAFHNGSLPIVSDGLVFCMDGKDHSNNGTTISEIINGTSGTLNGDPTLTGTYAPTFDGNGDSWSVNLLRPATYPSLCSVVSSFI